MEFKLQQNFDSLKPEDRLYESYGLPDLSGVAPNSKGQIVCVCPLCEESRHTKGQKTFNLDPNTGVWHCYHCGESGRVQTKQEYLDYRYRLTPRQKRIEKERDTAPEVQKEYKRPVWTGDYNIGTMALSPSAEQQVVLDYLTETRKLPLDVLKRAKINLPFETVRGRQQWCIRFNYFDRGAYMNWKERTIDKTFLSFTGGESIPYNIDGILRQPVCYITEGEFDTLAMLAAGFPETISVPNGGSSHLDWMDKYFETHFSDKETVYIASDFDEVGFGMMQEVIRRLGSERCRLVCWDDGCKDANDELVCFGEEGIRRCVAEALPVPVSGITTTKDSLVEPRLDLLIDKGLSPGNFCGLEEVDKKFRLEAGRFVVVTGRPGDGKSEFVDELTLRLSLLYGWKVAYFTPENTPIEYHLAKLVSKLTGYPFKLEGKMTRELYEGCKKWLGRNICHILPDVHVSPQEEEQPASNREKMEHFFADQRKDTDNYYLEDILNVAREAVQRRGVRQIVIDPYNSIYPDAEHRGMTEREWALYVCNACRNFANHYGCLVYLVAHPRKVDRSLFDGKKRRVEMNDICGSSDFGNKCDYCIVVDRDDEIPVVTVYVDKVKFKQNGSRCQFTLHYDTLSGRYVGCTVRKLPADALNPDAKPQYVKQINWNYFNLRWVDEDGEPTIKTYLNK